MDKEIVNILKKYGCAFMETDNKEMIEEIVTFAKECEAEQLTLTDVVKSLPNNEEVKAHIDTLPYYGTCTTEYNEGFEDGVKWLKEQLAK